jgi:hypothetical protein
MQDIALTAAIIRSTENSYKCPIVPKFVPILHDHVRSADEVHVVAHQKVVNDILAEAVTDASFVILPVDSSV